MLAVGRRPGAPELQDLSGPARRTGASAASPDRVASVAEWPT